MARYYIATFSAIATAGCVLMVFDTLATQYQQPALPYAGGAAMWWIIRYHFTRSEGRIN